MFIVATARLLPCRSGAQVSLRSRAVEPAVNTCFGCGPDNPHGLQVQAVEHDDGWVVAEVELPEHFHGGPGIAHGGIQAAVLDEVMGYAAHAAIEDRRQEHALVTVELSLRYRSPVPVEVPFLAAARATKVETPSIWVEAELRDLRGAVLTTAEARWRDLGFRRAGVAGDE